MSGYAVAMTPVISLQAARHYLNELDLSYIIETMCSPHYPLPRWIVADAVHCCQLYKNFLFLLKKHHPVALVPTREIDEFWHNHILHTKQYFQDCEYLFGHYLHHQPASATDNPSQLIDDFKLTKRLYLEEFGENL